MEVKIEQSWKDALAGEFEKPYFASLVRFLHGEREQGFRVYPPGSQIFKAFELTPVDKVKVVILGQDPYHGPGQAMGLSFSVPDNVPAPPSLKNIFKEIESDLGIRMSGRPNLEKWASHPHSPCRSRRFTQQNRVGRVYGRCNQVSFRQLQWYCLSSVGQFRPQQESPYRQFKALCTRGCTSVASGTWRLFRLPPFLADQQYIDFQRPGSD